MSRFGYFSILRANTYGIPLDPKGEVRRIRFADHLRVIGEAEIHHPRSFYNPSDPDILYPEPNKNSFSKKF